MEISIQWCVFTYFWNRFAYPRGEWEKPDRWKPTVQIKIESSSSHGNGGKSAPFHILGRNKDTLTRNDLVCISTFNKRNNALDFWLKPVRKSV